jgi:deoxycytidylate deaminase
MTQETNRQMMALAKKVAHENNSCHSRKIGCVIAKKEKVISTGVNGPPNHTPPVDSERYLKNIFLPILNEDEKANLFEKCEKVEDFAEQKNCPRRLVNAKSGEKNHLCPCVHAEINAIINSKEDLTDCKIYVYGAGCCVNCAGAIINTGIIEVYTIKEHDEYHKGTKLLFDNSKVKLLEKEFEYYF